jgi:hypothetical protein
MIVNSHSNGWEIIHQRAHGLLAMIIASHWRKDLRTERWIETMLAIAEHDDGQVEWEGQNHLTAAGAPADFTLADFTMVQLKRITKLSQFKSRWVALLISMHMSYLYEVRRGQGKEMDRFLDEQKLNQQKWQKELNITVKQTAEAYALMQWCDRLSLILCRQELPEGERWLDISKGPDNELYRIMQRKDNTVAVFPWPFEEENFELNVEATYLKQLSFGNDEELLHAMKQASVDVKQWQFVK